MRRICCILALAGLLPGVAQAANDLRRTPLIIDTVMTDPAFGGQVRFTVRWVNVASAGHRLVITDEEGRVVFQTTCPVGATEFESNVPLRTSRGLKVTVIDSGIAYISYE